MKRRIEQRLKLGPWRRLLQSDAIQKKRSGLPAYRKGKTRQSGLSAMKIAELEAHHNAYDESDQTIRTMVDNAEFPEDIPFCTASFPHIVPAISYRKKRGIAGDARLFGVHHDLQVRPAPV